LEVNALLTTVNQKPQYFDKSGFGSGFILLQDTKCILNFSIIFFKIAISLKTFFLFIWFKMNILKSATEQEKYVQICFLCFAE